MTRIGIGVTGYFSSIPPVADLLKHGATYFAELLHYRDAAVAAAAAAGAGPLPVAGPGIMMITGIPIIMMIISSSPCLSIIIYSPFHLYRSIVRCEE